MPPLTANCLGQRRRRAVARCEVMRCGFQRGGTHLRPLPPCIGSRPLRGRGGAVVAGANSCWLWHPRLAVGSQQRSEGPFPVRRPDGLCADATDGTGPFDRTLGVGRRGEFAGTEKRDFSRRIRRPAGTTQWEVTYNRHCHRHSLGKWFTMRCSKAMTSSNAARYTEPVGGGDPRTRSDRTGPATLTALKAPEPAFGVLITMFL
jgi:hypothetical protein